MTSLASFSSKSYMESSTDQCAGFLNNSTQPLLPSSNSSQIYVNSSSSLNSASSLQFETPTPSLSRTLEIYMHYHGLTLSSLPSLPYSTDSGWTSLWTKYEFFRMSLIFECPHLVSLVYFFTSFLSSKYTHASFYECISVAEYLIPNHGLAYLFPLSVSSITPMSNLLLFFNTLSTSFFTPHAADKELLYKPFTPLPNWYLSFLQSMERTSSICALTFLEPSFTDDSNFNTSFQHLEMTMDNLPFSYYLSSISFASLPSTFSRDLDSRFPFTMEALKPKMERDFISSSLTSPLALRSNTLPSNELIAISRPNKFVKIHTSLNQVQLVSKYSLDCFDYHDNANEDFIDDEDFCDCGIYEAFQLLWEKGKELLRKLLKKG